MPVYRLTTQLRMACDDHITDAIYPEVPVKYATSCDKQPQYAVGRTLEEYVQSKSAPVSSRHRWES